MAWKVRRSLPLPSGHGESPASAGALATDVDQGSLRLRPMIGVIRAAYGKRKGRPGPAMISRGLK